ncbi:hypothetical protein Tco_0596143 [Tanacetum coccineum]
MFDEYFKHSPSAVSMTVFAATLSPPNIAGASSSTSIAQDAPSLSTSLTTETTTPIQSTNVEQPNNEDEDADFDSCTFTNPFAPLVTSSIESSSRIVDTSNMHKFQQPHAFIRRWTKYHPKYGATEDGMIELKGQLLIELGKNAFSGTNGEDAVEHIENFLKVIDLIKVPKVSNNQIRVLVFHFSLSGAASKCPLHFKIRTAEWPTCNWKQDRYCNTRNLPELIREGNLIRYENYGWYDTIEDSEVKEEALNNKRILEESMNGKEESSDDEQSLDSSIDEWEDYEPAADIEADDNSNYNPYLDISQLFNDHTRKNEEDIGQDRIELNNDEDDDMGHL